MPDREIRRMAVRIPCTILTIYYVLSLLSGCSGKSVTRIGVAPARRVSEAESAIAKDAAVTALICMRRGDVTQMSSVLYSKSTGHLLLPKGKSRALRANAKDWGIDKMSDNQIRASIRAVKDADPHLLRDVVHFGMSSEGVRSTKTTAYLEVTALAFRSPVGKDVLLVLVKENGRWKLSELPAFTTRLLRYKRVKDAVHDHSVL